MFINKIEKKYSIYKVIYYTKINIMSSTMNTVNTSWNSYCYCEEEYKPGTYGSCEPWECDCACTSCKTKRDEYELKMNRFYPNTATINAN